MIFLDVLAEHVQDESEELAEGKHVDDILHCAMDMGTHCKTLIRKMCEKCLEEYFQAKEIDGKIAMPSKPHREADMSPCFIETLHANYLETPEDKEFFYSFVLRILAFWCLEKNKNRPFKHDCSYPCYDSRGMCKHALQHALRNELIDLRPELRLKSPSKNPRRFYLRQLVIECFLTIEFV